MANLKGLDLSHYNGVPDFPKIKAAGYSFVYLKASQGVTYIDKTFASNYKNARAAGLLVGAYHFGTFANAAAAKKEAAHFVKVIKGKKFDLKPVLDLEKDNTRGELVQSMSAFLNELARLGYSGALYSFGVFFIDKLQKHYGGPLYYARYASTPIGVSDYAIWQHTSKGRVPGVSGYVDLDVAGPTFSKIKTDVVKKVAVKPKQPTKPPVVSVPKKPAASNAPVKVSGFRYVTASLLNIRKDASTKHSPIGQLKFGDRVQYVKTVKEFAAIKSGSGVAYVSAKYLSDRAPVKATVKKKIAPRKPYVVKKGDTAGEVAKQLNVALARLKSLNHLNAKYAIYAGQKLKY